MNTETNPFGITLLPDKLLRPDLPSDRMTVGHAVLTEPGLNARSVQARPTDVERGLSSAKETRVPVAVKKTAPDGLSPHQRKMYTDAIKRAASWLPKAKHAWQNFTEALDTGRPLPANVMKSLRVHFGWTNTYADNHNLPDVSRVIDRLTRDFSGEVTASYHPQRELSPYSTPRHPRWIRARPAFNEDDPASKLIVYPDFFQSNVAGGTQEDARAKTVIHELLHTWEKAGGEDWSDVAQEDQHKDVGMIKKYLSNPASYSGFIHDLAKH